MQVGAEVEAHGLVGRPELNGQRGRVLSYDEGRGRYAVLFAGEAAGVLIKPGNLEARAPADGEEQNSGEGGLFEAVRKLRLERPEATAKELHVALAACGWTDVSFPKVKRVAARVSKEAREPLPVAQSTNPETATAFSPFDVGSVVTHLDGRKLTVIHSQAGGAVTVLTQRRQRRKLPQEELVLLDTPRNTCPTGYELITQSPSVGRIHRCDKLAEVVAERAAPPQLMQLAWQSFDECLGQFGSASLDGLVANPRAAWPVPPGVPPAVSRVICFALDAVSHHLVVEWRASRGWRVLQSYVKQEQAGAVHDRTGYTAFEWVTCSRDCGSADPRTHRQFGQGRWLSDAEALEFLARILRLRRLADAMVHSCLLPQVPFSVGPRPLEKDTPALEAWVESVRPVMRWAGDQIHAGEVRGATILRPFGGDVVVGLGDPACSQFDELLHIPCQEASELDAAYAAVTGEEFSAFHYLRLLHYAGSDYVQFGLDEQEKLAKRAKEQERQQLFKLSELPPPDGGEAALDDRTRKGWVIRRMHWGQD